MPAPKGQPHKKLSEPKRNEIALLVAELLSRGKTTGEIKRMIHVEYGLKPRSVEPYLRRAREAMRAETGKSVEDLRTESYYYYRSVLQDPEASHRDKLRARERIDKLLGLDKPVMTHNKNLNIDVTPEDISEMSDDELADYERRLLGES